MHRGGGAGRRLAGRAGFGHGGGDAEELEDELLDEDDEELLEDEEQDNGKGGGGGQGGSDPGRGKLDSQFACNSFFVKQGSFLTRL